MTDRSAPLVLPLADPRADVALVGGKGASLARLAVAGFAVPTGFHLTTEAYRRVTANGLQATIRGALAAEPEVAAERIHALFASAPIPVEIADAVRARYAELRAGAVAVRSSATAEDLPEASFAGQQDSFLDVRGESTVLEAVRSCWASLWTARAIAYRARHGIDPDDVSLAVVVQQMVSAKAAGVLFTADPVTGASDRLIVNAVRGPGEALVSGAADPQVIVLDPRTARVLEQHGDPAVDVATASQLARLGRRIEGLYGRPMDVEWAVRNGEVAVLQARPITVARAEEWNDSLAGDYLWICANLDPGGLLAQRDDGSPEIDTFCPVFLKCPTVLRPIL